MLRHVYLGRTSIEIAYLEDISEGSVNKRIDSAREKLGNVARRHAAQILADAEGWGDKNPPRKITLPTAPPPPPDAAPSTMEPQPDPNIGGPLAPPDGRHNRHDAIERISIIIFRTALLGAVAVSLMWVWGG
ncbi:hypothetical protein PQ455_07520 [Sphingomonas naphthae]|uniref:RNA polymerase sigma factor 70 region 4 type 2 domain-containing protein n=1 Tax=Sphingomonas naphthae TaxID=1813468 RepID=A0ABY7TRN0_9SPHN|nr:hypothetical protein [Sphingomonas naphthae]WCT75055.1 hypothetical protein PQ455_07520 [Sphingomonas naphthae]